MLFFRFRIFLKFDNVHMLKLNLDNLQFQFTVCQLIDKVTMKKIFKVSTRNAKRIEND